MKYFIIYWILVNMITCFLCVLDKYFAVKNHFRIKESYLLGLCFFGGGVGMWIGMYASHHKTKHKKFRILVPILTFLWILFFCFLLFARAIHFFPEKYYTAEDFGITVEKSLFDQNQNGIDDYTDILLGAKEEARRHPKYKSAYYAGGYAPLEEGVCTDVVIRALLNAGYSIKDLIDQDIKENVDLYPRVEGRPDGNIDFRRVKNLKVFFDRFLENKTLDLSKIEEWQPGDIVIFGRNYTHIGIISDKRNQKGIPYLIHNAGQFRFEEDALSYWAKKDTITGHYRFLWKEGVK